MMESSSRQSSSLTDAVVEGRLLSDYLDDLEYRRRVRPGTVKSYRSDLRKFLEFLSDRRKIRLSQCEKEDILAFLVEIQAEGSIASTRSRMISSLRGFFRFLKSRGRITQSPVDGFKGARIPEVLPEVLSEDDVEKLLFQGRVGDKFDRRSGMMFELMYATGMRISEIVNLKMQHIFDGEGIISVEKGKGGKGRMVVIPEATADRLKSYAKGERQLILGGGHSEWLFPSGSGSPISRQSIWMSLKKMGKKAGIKKSLYPHLLRHTCATHLLENGCDLLTVKALLGHADIGTTEIYTHILEERKRSVFKTAHPRA